MKKFFIYFLIISFSCLGNIYSQEKESGSRTGYNVAGLPLLNFDADEGVGYGAKIALYNYSTGYKPYFWSTEAQVFLTTGGKKDVFLFFDAPFLFDGKTRITGETGYEAIQYSQYYGIGNNSKYDKKLTEVDSTKHYYNFDRRRFRLFSNLQRNIFHPNIRGILGIGIFNTEIGYISKEKTLLEKEKSFGIKGGWTNFLKFGIIYDTRDNEPAPRSGTWTDLIYEISFKPISDYNYLRATFTDRRYFTIYKNIVFANRIVFEQIFGDVPFYEMVSYGSSFKRDEGLGGSKSLRGLLKNRLIDKTKFFDNVELRWRFLDFSKWSQSFFLATNVFLDFGRVWGKDAFKFSDFSFTKGAGIRIGWNENFIVAVDAGNSSEVPLAIYIGFGYLY